MSDNGHDYYLYYGSLIYLASDITDWEGEYFMNLNANALSYGIIAGILTITFSADSSLLITNVLLGLIAGKLMDK
ncbi:hypothetical protein [Salipaludibacillus daqingensis]|uniref:hypothetical protein n=1 Tax=Salipaludibacillus daqingensis TaxID=3041001 RepID=UPI00247313B5|nr:hypothetical protein [Salipaludibacillus daqingensis]